MYLQTEKIYVLTETSVDEIRKNSALNNPSLTSTDARELQNQIESLKKTIGDLQKRDSEKQVHISVLQKQAAKYGDRINVLTDMVKNAYDFMMGDENKTYSTPQERVWNSEHGFRYVVHHMTEDWKVSRVPIWEKLIQNVLDCQSILEMGCNIGANLKAIRYLNPSIALSGIEINPHAVEILKEENFHEIFCGSIIDFDTTKTYDLVFSRGVLIHINPEKLHNVMRNMVKHARKYVMIFEHYSPTLIQPAGYARRVKGSEANEGYQFWQDYSGIFHDLYPEWNIVREGVNATPDKKPKQGDLHWTIFKRPE